MTQAPVKINENERKVLEYLAEEWNSEMNCFYFRGIVSHTKLDLKTVRRSCRSLAKKGLAEYVRGLFNDEGQTAGSGYCATKAGALLVNGCTGCHVEVADMTTGECQECWEKRERTERLAEMEAEEIPTRMLGNVSLHDLGMLRDHLKKTAPLPVGTRLTAKGALALVNAIVKPYNRHYHA